jgi:hypothetical protein
MIPTAALGAMSLASSGGGLLSSVASPISSILGGGMFGGSKTKVDRSVTNGYFGDFNFGSSSDEEKMLTVAKYGIIAVAGLVALKIYKGR